MVAEKNEVPQMILMKKSAVEKTDLYDSVSTDDEQYSYSVMKLSSLDLAESHSYQSECFLGEGKLL